MHDIADPKFYKGDETIGPKKAREFLMTSKCKFKNDCTCCKIIKHISYKNSFEKGGEKFTSKELEVVQDADRFDAIGAIGIARCFNYGGFKNVLCTILKFTKLNMTKEEYKKSDAPTINHFYEKLLLLKDQMNTKTGQKIAVKRHRYMEQFLEQFYTEWDGLQ